MFIVNGKCVEAGLNVSDRSGMEKIQFVDIARHEILVSFFKIFGRGFEMFQWYFTRVRLEKICIYSFYWVFCLVFSSWSSFAQCFRSFKVTLVFFVLQQHCFALYWFFIDCSDFLSDGFLFMVYFCIFLQDHRTFLFTLLFFYLRGLFFFSCYCFTYFYFVIFLFFYTWFFMYMFGFTRCLLVIIPSFYLLFLLLFFLIFILLLLLVHWNLFTLSSSHFRFITLFSPDRLLFCSNF